MSDNPQGPGWWKASDGRWYPPEQAPSAQGLPTPPGAPAASGKPDSATLVRSLYDFQFDHFVTPKLIRFFYGFFVIVLSLGAVIFLLSALASGDSGAIVASLIFIPLGYFLYLIFGRMTFELIAALFRMSDDMRAVRRNTGG